MSAALKLTVYLGERARSGGTFAAERLLDCFATERLRVSALLRAAEGFGAKHQRRSDRQLSLSEDLPLAAVAVDRPDRVRAALERIGGVAFDGLVTLERARLVDGEEPDGTGAGPAIGSKLTIYPGRARRSAGASLPRLAVEVLREHRIDGATVLVGVDGTVGGERRRARFFARNAEVPAMVISIGAPDRVAAAAAALRERLGDVPMTIERVAIVKRDGRVVGELPPLGEGTGLRRKLMLYASERARPHGGPVHLEATRRLRREGAAGSTTFRGAWGFHGDHPPHGESAWRLRRGAPTVSVVIDEPSRSRRWLELLDELTPERGLITGEVVPAFRTVAGVAGAARLELADPWWERG